jgi:hypothetical protein
MPRNSDIEDGALEFTRFLSTGARYDGKWRDGLYISRSTSNPLGERFNFYWPFQLHF